MAIRVKTEAKPIDSEQIARCAYEIWEAEGRPDGRAMEHWIRAEAILRDGKSDKSELLNSAAAATNKQTPPRAPRRKNLEMVS